MSLNSLFLLILILLVSACGQTGLKIGAETGGATADGPPSTGGVSPGLGSGGNTTTTTGGTTTNTTGGTTTGETTTTTTGETATNPTEVSVTNPVATPPANILTPVANGPIGIVLGAPIPDVNNTGWDLSTLVGPNSVVAGVTRSSPAMSIVPAAPDRPVVAEGEDVLRQRCLANEVATGIYGTNARCSPMIPGIVQTNVETVGALGFSFTLTCPAGKVVVGYRFFQGAKSPTNTLLDCATLIAE